MVAIFAILSGSLCGLVAGSFLATLVVRWPRGETLSGRSHCDGCDRQLRVGELVPLLSWLALRGRCRSCRHPIDRRHIGLVPAQHDGQRARRRAGAATPHR